MFTLFTSPGSCAFATQITLEEVGAPYEVRRVDLKGGEQRTEAYLAINPKGRVPALLTGRGVLTETPATLAFLAQSFPEAGLAPVDDPFAFAEIQAFNSYLCSTVHVAHAHGRRGERWADDPASIADMRRKMPVALAATYEILEARMIEGPWVFGDRYTIADPYLFTVSGWLAEDGVDIARFPKVAHHFERMQDRPAVQRALAATAA